MRILLDENTPQELVTQLPGHEVSHVDTLGYKSLSNGELLAVAREEFDCLVTLDRGIQYQHNHAGHDLSIVVIRVPNSRKATVLAKASRVLEVLATLQPGEIAEVSLAVCCGLRLFRRRCRDSERVNLANDQGELLSV